MEVTLLPRNEQDDLHHATLAGLDQPCVWTSSEVGCQAVLVVKGVSVSLFVWRAESSSNVSPTLYISQWIVELVGVPASATGFLWMPCCPVQPVVESAYCTLSVIPFQSYSTVTTTAHSHTWSSKSEWHVEAIGPLLAPRMRGEEDFLIASIIGNPTTRLSLAEALFRRHVLVTQGGLVSIRVDGVICAFRIFLRSTDICDDNELRSTPTNCCFVFTSRKNVFAPLVNSPLVILPLAIVSEAVLRLANDNNAQRPGRSAVQWHRAASYIPSSFNFTLNDVTVNSILENSNINCGVCVENEFELGRIIATLRGIMEPKAMFYYVPLDIHFGTISLFRKVFNSRLHEKSLQTSSPAGLLASLDDENSSDLSSVKVSTPAAEFLRRVLFHSVRKNASVFVGDPSVTKAWIPYTFIFISCFECLTSFERSEVSAILEVARVEFSSVFSAEDRFRFVSVEFADGKMARSSKTSCIVNPAPATSVGSQPPSLLADLAAYRHERQSKILHDETSVSLSERRRRVRALATQIKIGLPFGVSEQLFWTAASVVDLLPSSQDPIPMIQAFRIYAEFLSNDNKLANVLSWADLPAIPICLAPCFVAERQYRQVVDVRRSKNNMLQPTVQWMSNSLVSKHGDLWLHQMKAAEELEIRVFKCLMLPQLFQGFGVPPSPRVLLHGMPGAGKSTIIHKVAKAYPQITVLEMPIGALYGPYVGQTEKNVRRLFAKARSRSPCVLVIDGVDQVGFEVQCNKEEKFLNSQSYKREDDETERRLLTQLLVSLDSVDSFDDCAVRQPLLAVVGTSQRPPFQLSEPLVRPGRLGFWIGI